jgi:hypothetical protein
VLRAVQSRKKAKDRLSHSWRADKLGSSAFRAHALIFIVLTKEMENESHAGPNVNFRRKKYVQILARFLARSLAFIPKWFQK